jgi:hypothetical protein
MVTRLRDELLTVMNYVPTLSKQAPDGEDRQRSIIKLNFMRIAGRISWRENTLIRSKRPHLRRRKMSVFVWRSSFTWKAFQCDARRWSDDVSQPGP